MLKLVKSYPSSSSQSLSVVVCPWCLPWVTSWNPPGLLATDVLSKIQNVMVSIINANLAKSRGNLLDLVIHHQYLTISKISGHPLDQSLAYHARTPISL